MVSQKTLGFLKKFTYLDKEQLNSKLDQIHSLAAVANARGQKLSQMAIAWLLAQPQITSVLIGASSSAQLKENVSALKNLHFSDEELKIIEEII